MKSRVDYWFNKFLTIMEEPATILSKKEWRELEDRIKAEIAFHRKRKPKNAS